MIDKGGSGQFQVIRRGSYQLPIPATILIRSYYQVARKESPLIRATHRYSVSHAQSDSLILFQ